MRFIWIFLTLILVHLEAKPSPLPLTTISVIDRNGMSETIQTKERLEQYASVDFLKPQPYQKVMRTYQRNKKGEVLSLLTSYYPNGQIKQYLELINSSAYGPYWEWHENGNPKLTAFVIGGMGDLGPSSEKTWLFDGTAKAWSEEGALLCEIPYEKGAINGVSTYYHSNGTISKKVPTKDGKIEGTIEKFSKEGTLLESISYKGGLRNGESTAKAFRELYKEGLLLSGEYYKQDGTLICSVASQEGKQALFEDGRLTQIRDINEGLPEGLVEEYDEEGVLTSKYKTKDGEKHGEEIEYYPLKKGKEPKPRLSINWFEGKIQGVVKTWYPNGRQESKREMSDNKKNGWLSAWYEDGSIMMIEEYDADTLRKGSYFKRGDRTPVSEVRDGKGIATLYDAQGNYLKKIHYQQGSPRE